MKNKTEIEKNYTIMKKEFEKYVNNYNMEVTAIKRKFDHSLRVMDFCALLAEYNNLSDEDNEIAMITGLLHDYARFEQWAKYGTYDDMISVDHADLGVQMLFENNEIKNYCDNISYYDEIHDAIKYHNKLEIPNNLSEHNILLCKIIRDADKLDIFNQLSANKDMIKQDNGIISDEIKASFLNKKAIGNRDVKNLNEMIILKLAMIYDLNFKYSLKYIKKEKLIEKIYKNIDDKDLFKLYFDFINEYIDKELS